MPSPSATKLAAFHDRLGKEPDHLVAREAGVSRSSIVNYRKQLGIPAYEGYKFGAGPGRQAPAAAEPATRAPRRRIVRPAAPASIASASASRTRAPAARAAASAAGTGRVRPFYGRRSKLDPYAAMLGKAPDDEIAKLAGVTPENVRTYRARRGIELATADRDALAAPPAPVVAATPAPSPSPSASPGTASGQLVYIVQVETPTGVRAYGLVAADIAGASHAAANRLRTRGVEGELIAVTLVAQEL
ncbi:hypothetical protein HY631_04395 [Candidatus Uhrbacteria bacterium]|nr:hypothetical protein [Candidatus Uhrbacteria bacterium]